MASAEHRLFLTPAEATELVSVSRSKVYELIRDGTIPSVRLGKSLRVPLRELEGWATRLAAETERARLASGPPSPRPPRDQDGPERR